MAKEELFRTGNKEEIWQTYCGFLDLSLQEFRDIQESLLLEQIELVADSPLGKQVMRGNKPTTVEEFRSLVPLTAYEDYSPYLDEQNEGVLAVKPCCWARTSGWGGSFKWVPFSQRALEKHIDATLAGLILSSADRRGDIEVKEGDRILCTAPPRPYISGITAWGLVERFNFRTVLPLEIAEKMDYQEMVEEGFKTSLHTGMDFISCPSPVLLKVGEAFERSSDPSRGTEASLSMRMLHPKVLLRLWQALVRSKLAGRPLLPKDWWQIKGLASEGTHASIYKEKLEYYWGRLPYQHYWATESGNLAMQSWLKKGMTFYPYLGFFEFIPEEEWAKSGIDKEYQPSTVLIDEVEAGKIYEIVITNFYGMPFLRYRLGDLIKIISLKEGETRINLPQMIFQSRAGDTVEIDGFTRLDQKTVWQAIANTGLKYADWTCRKEYLGDQPCLHLYIELREDVETAEVEARVHQQLKVIDPGYRDFHNMLEVQSLRTTLLPRGSFQRYYEEKLNEGADLAHRKPPLMNASDDTIEALLGMRKVVEAYVRTFVRIHRPILRPEFDYEVKAFVSKQQGSLVWFQFVPYPGSSSFSFVDEPISDKLAEIPQKGFDVAKGMTVLFLGTNIVREEDKLIIIKGGNSPEAWSQDEARRDAQNEVRSIASKLP